MTVDKGEMRILLLSRRAELSREIREEKSREIAAKVLTLPEWTRAKAVMLYLNTRSEVETDHLAQWTLEQGKRLILPRCAAVGVIIPAEVRNLTSDVVEGSWGIREPKGERLAVDPGEIDLVLIPAVGFDRQGNRLGYGKGYYDLFLPKLNRDTPRIGLAFACQIAEELPVDPHDQKVTMIVTEKSIYRV